MELASDSVFDPTRGVRVKLTPEERVRQAVVYYLTTELGYPLDLIANEATITVGKVSRRCDTVVFSPGERKPLMVLEYKAPSVPLSPKVLAQALEYNSVLSARVVVVTNGREMCVYLPDGKDKQPMLLSDLPRFEALIKEDQ